MALLFSVLILFLAIGFILVELTNYVLIDTIVNVIIVFFIIAAIPTLRGATLYIILMLMGFMVVLLWGNTDFGMIILDGAQVNLTLVSLFIFAPLLGIPVRTGNYIDALKTLFKKWLNNAWLFYFSIFTLTHILGVVINIGSVTINYYLKGVSNIQSKRLIAGALNRGFTTSIYWSPYFAAMALMVSQLNIEWITIVLYSLGFSIISFIVGFLLEIRTIIKEEQFLNKEVAAETEVDFDFSFKNALRKGIELSVLLVLTICVVLIVERISSLGMVLSICITAIFFPLLWCFIKGDKKDYLDEVKTHVFTTLPKMKKEITLFLTAGLFSAAFVSSTWSDLLVNWVNTYFSSSTLLLTLLMTTIIVLTASFGLHPIILVTILVTSISPESIGLSDEYFAVMLLASWGFSNTLSPATAVNNLLAGFLNSSLLDVSFRWNWKYVLILTIILPFYLKLLKI